MGLRASDEDREGVAQALRRHLLAGRLRTEEFEQRVEAAYGAQTLDQLRALTRDLPRTAARPERPPRLWPGNRPLAVRFEVEQPPATVMSEAMRTIAPALLRARYRLEQSDATRLVFRRRLFSLWAILAAVLLPVIGLIVLFAGGRETSEVVVSVNPLDEQRTVVDVFGVAPRGVRRAMLELER